MSRVAIVTGAGSGIGSATARALLSKGWVVYDFSRTDHAAEGIKHISVDVSDEARVKEAMDAVVQAEGGLDAVVNNAGFGISGAIEFTRREDSERLMHVNLMGADNVARAAIPHLRAAGGGTIVFISSVAALLPIPFQAWYSASKSALLAYSLALRNEVRPFGIRVSCVLPGDVATGFTAARKKAHIGDDVYAGRIEKAVSAMEKDERDGMSPNAVAARVIKIAAASHPRPVYVVGIKYRAFALLNRLLPSSFVNWVVGKLY